MIPSKIRVGIQVKGIVQGVGFRPFVFRLAKNLGLGGFVRNEGGFVYIEAQGSQEKVESLLKGLKENPPPLARIDKVSVTELKVDEDFAEIEFHVLESQNGFLETSGGPGIPPDCALCEACRKELLDPNDRRYLYPFINCTDCGPRFTIIEKAPYDRKRTSMKKFPMCPLCEEEYRNPEDRRFHAEPDACWDCGPIPVYARGEAHDIDYASSEDCSDGHTWLKEVQTALLRGSIVAVKGVGGFHIACNALDGDGIKRLRQKKHRPRKPFAVMVRDLDTVKRWFYLSKAEEEILSGKEAPIVLLRKKPSCPIHASAAPGLDHLGIMLPYSPLHFLLFQPTFTEDAPMALCMTSGNVSGLPLVFENEEARKYLGPIVDGFVWHNRDILRPCDDSVVRAFDGKTLFYRRSRGYVPDVVPPNQFISRTLAKKDSKVFGGGAEGKNTFCLLDRGGARLSQHVGDLFNEESLSRYSFLVQDFTRLYGFEPDLVAMDLHPNYQVNRVLKDIFPHVRHVMVQHHHAHMASCLAEWGIAQKAVGIVADGTGYGLDGKIWGGEILYGDVKKTERLYHLDYVSMPGSEKAVEEPWRMAVSYLQKVFGEDGLIIAKKLMPRFSAKIDLIWPLIGRDEFPKTSSTGRLFDAVGAILGVSDENSYDGEMASLTGEMALRLWKEKDLEKEGLPRPICEGANLQECSSGNDNLEPPSSEAKGIIPLDPIVQKVVEGILSGKDKRQVAFDFHLDLAKAFGSFAVRCCRLKGTSIVTLSGGVFQNPLFLRLLVDYLKSQGQKVYWPQILPPNDGGICLGQAFTALLEGGITECV